jgi:hypothetical protein
MQSKQQLSISAAQSDTVTIIHRRRAIDRDLRGLPIMLILANTITAEMGLIPGLAIVGPAMGLPLSVLAAFVERPFYSLAGVHQHTIWYSLQANLISLGVGVVATFFAAVIGDSLHHYYALFAVWPFLAVCVSIVVERAYLRYRRQRFAVRWGWTIAGNVVSAGLCIALLFLVEILQPVLPQLRQALTPYNFGLTLFAFAGSAALFFYSFVPTNRSRPSRFAAPTMLSDPARPSPGTTQP